MARQRSDDIDTKGSCLTFVTSNQVRSMSDSDNEDETKNVQEVRNSSSESSYDEEDTALTEKEAEKVAHDGKLIL